ncbi:MAG: PAS domain-containing sensor histidine kinase [Candidatus Scalindua sp.]
MNKLLQALLDKLSRLGSTVSHELCNFEQRLNNKQAVEKLTKNNKYSQSLLNSVVNVIICLSPDHRIIEFNLEAERLYERKREEVLGKDYFELFLPEEVHDAVANDIKKVLAGEPTRGFENEIIIHGEKKRVLSWNVSRLLDSHGRHGGIIAVGQDITEYKHLEEQLTKLSCAVEQSPSTIIITDIKGTIEYVNPKFTQLTGYTFEEAVGQNPRILKTDKTAPGVYECLWKAITSGREWRGEFCNKKKNGDLYWESASISPIKNSKGVITHFVAVKEDITKRKRMEKKLELFNKYLEERVAERTKELKKSHNLLNSVIEGTTDIIFVKDLKSRLIMINSAGVSFLGMSKENIIGKDNAELLPPNIADKITEDDREIMTTGKTKVSEEMVPMKGYTGTFLTTKSPYYDHQGKVIGLIGIAHDITDRKHTEEQIKVSLKEKEVLLNEVHHRVKNNLQIISSLLDMSSMQTQNQETIELFAESRNRVDSIALIHSQLYKSERFDEIDMERHIQELSGNLLNIYSKEKTITLDIKSANVYLPVTQAVPCALVLNELISNSLKHAYRDGEQGTISISMQQSDDNTILMRVRDNGVGIPEEIDIGRTKSLGLRLTRNIVNKQLNGKIKIIRNKGTEFIVEFKNSKEDS